MSAKFKQVNKNSIKLTILDLAYKNIKNGTELLENVDNYTLHCCDLIYAIDYDDLTIQILKGEDEPLVGFYRRGSLKDIINLENSIQESFQNQNSDILKIINGFTY